MLLARLIMAEALQKLADKAVMGQSTEHPSPLQREAEPAEQGADLHCP
jgi:hypothetical protein